MGRLSAPDYMSRRAWATANEAAHRHDETVSQPSHLVISQPPPATYDVFRFRRFRLNLIGFLKLPLDVNEIYLRGVLKGSSTSLLASYLARAECALAESRAAATGEQPLRD
jgi:hypothetical protein